MVKEVARQFATIQGLADSAALDFHERKQWTQSGRKLVPHSPPPAPTPTPAPGSARGIAGTPPPPPLSPDAGFMWKKRGSCGV